jgi:hypothetical protein
MKLEFILIGALFLISLGLIIILSTYPTPDYINQPGQLRCGVSILWEREQGRFVDEKTFVKDSGEKVYLVGSNCVLYTEQIKSVAIGANDEITKE